MLVWWQCSGGCESRAQFPAPCSCEPPLSELCCRCRCWQPKLPTVAATPEPDLARSGATGEAAQLTVATLAHSSSPPGPPRHHHCPNTRGCCCCCCWKQQSSSRTMLPSDRNELFIINPCDHSYPSFAKPIDTSHRVVCHGTLSAGKQAGRGKLH